MMEPSVEADAPQLLVADHENVLRLLETALRQYRAGRLDAAGAALRRGCLLLRVHDAVEEQHLYPFAAGMLDDEALLARAALDHAILRAILDEIEAMDASEPETWSLAAELEERLRRHACEEEEVLLMALARSGADLARLGAEISQAKNVLLECLRRDFSGDSMAEMNDAPTSEQPSF